MPGSKRPPLPREGAFGILESGVSLSRASLACHPIANCVPVGSFVKGNPLPLELLNLTWLRSVKFLFQLR